MSKLFRSSADRRSIGFSSAFALFLLCAGSLLFWELFMHIALFWEITWRIIFVVIFSVSFAALMTALLVLLPSKVKRVALWVLLSVLYLWFTAQLIYFKIFGGFISLNVIGMGGDAIIYFFNLLVDAILRNLWLILLLALPLVACGFVLKKKWVKTDKSKRILVLCAIFLAICIGVFLVGYLLLGVDGTGVYTVYDVYHNVNTSTDTSVYNLGILTTLRIEFGYMITGAVGEVADDDPSDDFQIIDKDELELILGTNTSYPYDSVTGSTDTSDGTSADDDTPSYVVKDQILNIDFEKLKAEAEASGDEALFNLHNYFSLQTPTRTNEYTGYFEGKNLIYMVCEGFSPLVISEELTPTLYKLSTEGFIFENFYTSYRNKTTNGEYSACLGIFPDLSREYMDNGSFAASSDNYLPYALGNVFKSQAGIQSHAFHNYYASYYNRKKSHPNMGYTLKAMNRGMTFTYDWPSSDYEMMQQSVKDFVNEERFHAYYMTFSGHTPYTFSTNPMSMINKSGVDHLDYSEAVKAYIACHLELEKAMAYLMDELGAAGQLEDTVIVMTTDHYPYGLGNSPYKNYSELAGYTVDGAFGIYENAFICWSYGMEDPIVVDTPCCTIDILPTILNLFGFEYDSRLLMGRDVLDPSALHVAIIYNGSFVTDKVMFNSTTGKVTYLVDKETVSDAYVDVLNKIVQNEFTVSTAILNNDYYRVVFGDDQ